MVNIFGGNPREFGNFYKLFCFNVYYTFYHRIYDDSLRMYNSRIDIYRRAILERMKSEHILEEPRYDSELIGKIFRLVWMPFEYFRFFGFLGCTYIRMFLPQNDPNKPLAGENLQREFYSLYFRSHGLKFQVVFLDGIIGRIFGCSLRHNDNSVLNMSNLST